MSGRPVPVTLLLVIVPDTPINAVVSPVFIRPPMVNSKSYVSDVSPLVVSNVPIYCSAANDAAINIDCRYRKKKQLRIWSKYIRSFRFGQTLFFGLFRRDLAIARDILDADAEALCHQSRLRQRDRLP